MVYNMRGKNAEGKDIIFSLSDGIHFNPADINTIQVDKNKILIDSIQLGFNLGDIFYNEVFVGDIVSTLDGRLYFLDFIDFIGCVFKDLNTHEITEIGNDYFIFSDSKNIAVPTNTNYNLPQFIYFSKIFSIYDLRWSNEKGIMLATNDTCIPIKRQYINQIVSFGSNTVLAAGHKNCRMRRGKIIN